MKGTQITATTEENFDNIVNNEDINNHRKKV